VTILTRLAAVYLAPVALVSFLTLPTWADDTCKKPLVLLGTLPMANDGQTGVFTIPIQLAGVEKQFLFDTGGYFTQVAPATADELKLKRRQSYLELYGTNGSKSREMVTLPTFAVGPVHGSNYEIPVGTDNSFAGIFTPIGFTAMDFDVDFAARKLSLFSSDHCDGKVIYWPFKAFAAVPVTVREDNHLTIPVTVDGHHLTAIIDTGASTSTVRLDMAKFVFGLKPDADDMKVVGHLGDDQTAPIYQHAFQTMSFEGITINNPHILILTDIVNKNADHSAQTGSLTKRVSDDLTLPEVIVGMDVLSKLHMYIAFRERRVYLTEASAPPTPARAP
jgi:predicted aspartyl protease